MTAIQTKFIPATNTKPARVKATTMQAGKKQSVTIGYHSSSSPHYEAATKLIEKCGWGLPPDWAYGDTAAGTVWVNINAASSVSQPNI